MKTDQRDTLLRHWRRRKRRRNGCRGTPPLYSMTREVCCYISVPQLTPTLMINTNISPVQSRLDNQPAGSDRNSSSLSSFPILLSPRYSTPSALFLYPSLLSKLSGSLPAASIISTFGCSSVISMRPGLLGLSCVLCVIG